MQLCRCCSLKSQPYIGGWPRPLARAATYTGGPLTRIHLTQIKMQHVPTTIQHIISDAVLKKAFIKVAQNAHVTADWKFLARQLGIPETDLQVIERDHQGLRERCLQSLVRWRERAGTAATTDELLKYLRRCRYHHVIGKHIHKILDEYKLL